MAILRAKGNSERQRQTSWVIAGRKSVRETNGYNLSHIVSIILGSTGLEHDEPSLSKWMNIADRIKNMTWKLRCLRKWCEPNMIYDLINSETPSQKANLYRIEERVIGCHSFRERLLWPHRISRRDSFAFCRSERVPKLSLPIPRLTGCENHNRQYERPRMDHLEGQRELTIASWSQ